MAKNQPKADGEPKGRGESAKPISRLGDAEEIINQPKAIDVDSAKKAIESIALANQSDAQGSDNSAIRDNKKQDLFGPSQQLPSNMNAICSQRPRNYTKGSTGLTTPISKI